MKSKNIHVLICVVLILVLSVGVSAEVKKIKSLGQFTFVRVRGEIPTAEVMKMLAERYAQDIRIGFEQAGMGEIYQPFIDQLKTTQFEDSTWNIGETVQWMLFRSQGKVKVSGPLEWAGNKPVESFTVKVKVGYKTYTFMIPKPCGNIAYVGMVEEIQEAICNLKVSPAKANINDPITVDMSGSQNAKSLKVEIVDKQGNKVASKELSPDSARWQTKLDKPGEYVFKGTAINMANKSSANPCEARVYINYPPVAVVVPSCEICREYVGRPITFDASRSSDPDGEVTRVAFELKDSNGRVVDSAVVNQKPYIWEKTLYEAGQYTISVTAYDNDGAASILTSDSSKIIKVTRKTFFIAAEAGSLFAHGSSYSPYVFARVGMFMWLNPDKLSLTFTSGAGCPTEGWPWKAIIMTELLGNFHIGKFYIGAGPGFTTEEQDVRECGVDAVGQVGLTLFDNYKNMGQLFFEFRAPIGRNFDDHHKMGIGFRLNF